MYLNLPIITTNSRLLNRRPWTFFLPERIISIREQINGERLFILLFDILLKIKRVEISTKFGGGSLNAGRL